MARNIGDIFFSLGPKDPVLKARFDYSLLWVIFLTFAAMSVNYFYMFASGNGTIYIGWGILMLIFSYFNFNNLKSMRESLNMQGMLQNALSNPNNNSGAVQPIEKKEEMLAEFKDIAISNENAEAGLEENAKGTEDSPDKDKTEAQA